MQQHYSTALGFWTCSSRGVWSGRASDLTWRSTLAVAGVYVRKLCALFNLQVPSASDGLSTRFCLLACCKNLVEAASTPSRRCIHINWTEVALRESVLFGSIHCVAERLLTFRCSGVLGKVFFVSRRTVVFKVAQFR